MRLQKLCHNQLYTSTTVTQSAATKSRMILPQGYATPLLQGDVEAGREVGLNGYLAATGENHSFQGCSTQGLDLKPLSWEVAQVRTAPGIQPSPNQFGDFILVLSRAFPIRDKAKKGRRGQAGREVCAAWLGWCSHTCTPAVLLVPRGVQAALNGKLLKFGASSLGRHGGGWRGSRLATQRDWTCRQAGRQAGWLTGNWGTGGMFNSPSLPKCLHFHPG